jgi:hypothetical protein
MSLKKYLAYSFGTLWTVVLIIALIATIIHQVRFQDSATHLHLKFEVTTLESQNAQLGFQKYELEYSLYKREQEIIKMLNTPYYE